MSSLYDWLVVASAPQLGGYRIGLLLERTTPACLLQMSDHDRRGLGLSERQCQHLKHPPLRRIERCLEWHCRPNQQIITLGSPLYPPLLKAIPSPPPILFVRGEPRWLHEPQLAIVGSRAASIDGLEAASEFAAAMVAAEYVVTSGLALGIDSRAHFGALKNGGATVAVLGSGLDKVYPAKHRELAETIVEQGALVSEFWPDEAPRPQHFPRRNRVISGLSVGVLVVEAEIKSGSLITARYALEQGRDVFAIPGSIYSAMSRGCHALIKNGAKLVETPVDIFEDVGVLTECAKSSRSILSAPQPKNEKLPFPALLANVGNEATPVDVVAERSGLPVHEVMMQLLELELHGVVAAVPGGYVRTRRG
ncbi:DNA processing protein DprA [Photobacterium gaetbulicola]|uniref:DNA processing protein DprA n=1 Tax=Photobacterium gaetbulicola TaxID=1295392 RepID=A0A0B9GVP6_9GAMM|nr:DNA-processing protein DprA [Photobacterium gaetbulicola]KHT60707.1 DNA processing protein DprA [Photobacterium gaetbulicola]